MQTSRTGKMFITSLEGICLSKYLDSVGVWTIGVGATRSEIPDLAGWSADRKLTIEEAFKLLDHSITKYEDAVNKALMVSVQQHQFDALVSVCYNIGTGGLAKSTFIRRINSNMNSLAIAQGILMWNKPPEIIGRRTKEANLYTKGNYGSTKALLFGVKASNHKPDYRNGKEINLEDYI